MPIKVSAYIAAAKGQSAGASFPALFLQESAKPLIAGVVKAKTLAAKHANETSKSHLRRRRAREEGRPGRDYASIKQTLDWQPTKTGVALNVRQLDSQAPHWIIHEIGTGNQANTRIGGQSLARGRPSRNAASTRSVKKQVGRPIWVLHTFGDDPTVRTAKTKRALKRRVGRRKKDIPLGNAVIGKEIKAQHFIREGAREGFRVYQESVLAAARASFAK